MNQTKRRSAIQIMGQLIGLVKPLLIFMISAILLGTIGCWTGACSWTHSTVILSNEKY